MMPQDRRLYVRKTPKHIGYLSLPRDNGGFVIDISEGGLGFQTISPLTADGPIQIRFAIDSAERIRVFAELAWIDETRKAGGLRFIKLPDAVRAQIRAWIGQTGENAIEIPPAEPIAEQGTVEQVAQQPVELVAEKAVEPLATEEIACSETSGPVPEVALPAESPGDEAVIPAVETARVVEIEAFAAGPDPTPVSTTGFLLPDNGNHPFFHEPSNPFSIFSSPADSDREAIAAASVRSSLTVRHPVVAVGGIIVLAFFTAIPLFSYVARGRAGDMLFHWSQRVWSTPVSRPAPQNPAPPATPAPDASQPPPT